ncbi:arsenosugar biosynthesis radical SAM protein ArsS [Marinilongibacter aquaticus]|uniref:arsenosugar biosynthesis radical SAM (seleno)protein ArsS n=1 Tax=Marinilongibacter aquaticus TaxID=2975157 RepID=UPI0021BD0C65|nr:arsenosugar biosynthesis radical SAM (seleno)protein ArsS [Marinilongibacter aquaticus]UBM57234.1 arsenosugar biosynthesis radical SAM protein ArsS [Marinilongibacter aquaticus]
MANPVKSLKAQKHELGETEFQLKVLNDTEKLGFEMPKFKSKLQAIDLYPLKPTGLEILQINVGKMCNQVCAHCHVDAGPDRKEIMTKETMELCLDALKNHTFHTVDLTGGAPEMNPNFRWFVEQIRAIDSEIKIIVRCNLTIILANPRFHDLPDFFKTHKVEVVSSLPAYTEARTDAQRGNGVFRDSIKALQMLNAVGYGQVGSGLELNLVYNPSGAFLPSGQAGLELNFKRKLKADFGIEFNQLFAITNIPISRYLDYLIVSDNYGAYMEKLLNAYNPGAAEHVMCRNTLSIGWDGFVFDCDFNQMLDLKVACGAKHLRDFDREELENRSIIVNQHCFGCTAGAGSSCGGEVAQATA